MYTWCVAETKSQVKKERRFADEAGRKARKERARRLRREKIDAAHAELDRLAALDAQRVRPERAAAALARI